MKTVLITGASSGIGAGLAKSFSADGYHVIACGRDPARLEDEIGKRMGKEQGCESLGHLPVSHRLAQSASSASSASLSAFAPAPLSR